MWNRIRYKIGHALVMLGMAILPSGTRRLLEDLIMFHVPGALTERRKEEIRNLYQDIKRDE